SGDTLSYGLEDPFHQGRAVADVRTGRLLALAFDPGCFVLVRRARRARHSRDCGESGCLAWFRCGGETTAHLFRSAIEEILGADMGTAPLGKSPQGDRRRVEGNVSCLHAGEAALRRCTCLRRDKRGRNDELDHGVSLVMTVATAWAAIP